MAAPMEGKTAKEINNEGVRLFMAGRLAEARGCYEQALALDPEDATILNNLGFFLVQQQQVEEGISCYKRAIALQTDNATAYLNLGNAQVTNRQIEEGLANLQHAAEVNREDASPWESMARVFLLLQRPDAAARAWEAALQRRPGHLSYAIELAVSLAALKRHDEALGLLEQVTDADPENVQAWTQMGIVFFLRQDYGLAKERFRYALSLAPEHENARYHLALTHLYTGQRDQAMEELGRIIKYHPDNVKARTDLGVLTLAAGRPADALTLLEVVLETTNNGYSKARYYIALTLCELGRPHEARPILDELVAGHEQEYKEQSRRLLAKIGNGG